MKTPLMKAVLSQNQTQVDKLLAEAENTNTAIINQQDENGSTALMLAAEKGYSGIVSLLLAKANIRQLDLKDHTGATDLILAASHKHDDVVTLLLNKLQTLTNNVSTETIASFINTKDNYGNTALAYAIQNKAPNKNILALIDAGADVNTKNISGFTPLNDAIFSNDIKKIELLINRKADIETKDEQGKTPLMHAAITNDYNIYDLLIANHANVSAIDNENKTPLMYAAMCCTDTYILLLLLAKCDNINAVDKDNKTALMYAAENNNKAVCALLIEKGANINAVDKDGKTALMYAEKNNNTELCNLLIEKGANKPIDNTNSKINTNPPPSLRNSPVITTLPLGQKH